MLWGAPWSVPWGGHEEQFTALAVAPLPGGVRVGVKPQLNYDQFARLVVDGLAQGAPRWCPSDAQSSFAGVYDQAAGTHLVNIVPQGDWPGSDIDYTPQVLFFLAGRADRAYIEITAAPTFESYGETGQLTAWSIAGAKRFANCRPVVNRPTWGQCDLTLVDVTGTRTVQLLLDGRVLAAGSRSGDGVITLAAVNDSGVTGQVTVAYTGDVMTGACLIGRWPASYYIRRQLGGGTAVYENIYDDGRATLFHWRSPVLAAGTWTLAVYQRSETAGLGSSASRSVVIVAPPVAPGAPALTVPVPAPPTIQFAASGTSTYNVYDSAATGLLDTDVVSATIPAGTGTIVYELPAISPTFTGIRYLLIRAVAGGVEEGNLQVLEIEYAAGAVVTPRPPVPGISAAVQTVTRTLTVSVSINTAGQRAAAATVELFVFALGGAPNYAVPTGTAAVPAGIGDVINVNIVGIAPADGWFMFAVRTKTAGGVQSGNTEQYGPVRLGYNAGAAASSFTARPGV